MPKIKIKADPTFTAPVDIPVAGGASESVKFTFKHRTGEQLDELIKTREGKTHYETVSAVIVGWEFEDEFNEANLKEFLENYIGAGMAIYRTYLTELIQAREKN